MRHRSVLKHADSIALRVSVSGRIFVRSVASDNQRTACVAISREWTSSDGMLGLESLAAVLPPL